ncbi:MAG: helix-turn-helix domain-containing protein [Alcaligenes faecalis]|jgi:transcriptional regulator with XRE-family HTH domain|nr:helix-turn-helix transcriptional regulator [Alcaligenes faecalis]MCH4223630.1 helix-turn-helix domain-containing protein [Alcaligenes faecalis]
MSIRKTVGENVRRIRVGKGWSQESLSEKSDLHRTYISGVERGVRNPTIEIVEQIAFALGVPVTELFNEVFEG